MSKETYFEMCEQLEKEPVESEIPLEMSDFPEFVQQCFLLYNLLEDRWDSMAGGYLGKNYSLLFNLYDLYEIATEERLLMLQFLQCMDNIRQKIVADKIKAKSPATK